MKFLLVLFLFILLLFAGLFFFTGLQFKKLLTRSEKNEPVAINISPLNNSPLKNITINGYKYMETLPYEDFFIQSFDELKLHARLYPAPIKSNKYVLGIHGFKSSSRKDFAPYIKFYHTMGYNILLTDNRAHGESEGKYLGMGVLDSFDCIDWAKFLVSHFGSNIEIFLHGISMGGATVLSASGSVSLPMQVKGIISDCGYTSMWEQVKLHITGYMKLPAFPFLNIGEFFCKHYAGYDFRTITPLKQVRKAKVPILFIHGENDQLVPVSMGKQLYKSCSSCKKLLLVPGAGHAESISIDSEACHKAIIEFLGKNSVLD